MSENIREEHRLCYPGPIFKMTAVDYIKAYGRMTDNCNIPCEECPLYKTNNGMNTACYILKEKYTEKHVEIVEKWAKEHPLKKTFLDDVKEKFPDIDMNKGNGYEYPLVCRKRLYAKDGEKVCMKNCYDCWNEEYNGG